MIDMLMILGVLFLFICFPSSIIASVVFKVKKKSLKIPLSCIPISFFVAAFCLMTGSSMYSETEEYKESMERKRIEKEKEEEEIAGKRRIEEENKKQEEEERKRQEELERLEQEKEEKRIEEEKQIDEQKGDYEIEKGNGEKSEIKEENTKKETKVEKVINYEYVFFYDLMNNLEHYNGKNIRTVIQVFSCHQSNDNSYIRSQYADYDLTENSDEITIYPDNYQDFEYGEYVMVEGVVAKNGSSDVLNDAHIVSYGDDARKTFEDDLKKYKEEYAKKLLKERETFIESCVEVSYDDLRRYPDTYKDKPIKLTIYIEDVEPDGWIFPGDIIATYQDEELAVYDDRMIREPRIIEGDTITVYAVGYGLSKMKIKEKGLIFDKAIDEYEIPSIKIKYMEGDEDLYEKGLPKEENNSYDKGREARENLKEKSDSIDWDDKKESAREAGEKAAEWINDLIE